MLRPQNPFGLGIQKEISPKKLCQCIPLDTQPLLKHAGKPLYRKRPPIRRGRKNHVPLLRCKIDILIFLLLKLLLFRRRRGAALSGLVFAGFAGFAPFEIVGHAVSRKKRAHDSIDLFEEFHEVCMRFQRGELEFGYETVHFIEDEERADLLQPGLSKHRHRLQASTLGVVAGQDL